jgi:hypothetical protein
MRPEELERERRAVVAAHGEWTHHNIRLGDGAHTISADPTPGQARRLERLVQTVADVADGPFEDLRVLDLACHEGLNALEFGAQGAEVVGVEIREAHLAKADFARRALGLERVRFIRDDVRNVGVADYGSFDVVLCLGILYHLDAPDVFELLQRISELCTRVALIDTNISVEPVEQRQWGGRDYAGRRYFEHDASSSAQERERDAPKRSYDNPEAFWLTRASLLNALADVGFTSVQECLNPGRRMRRDRPTLMALKGRRRKLRVAAGSERVGRWRWREGDEPPLHANQSRLYDLAVRNPWLRGSLARVPPSARTKAKRLLVR